MRTGTIAWILASLLLGIAVQLRASEAPAGEKEVSEDDGLVIGARDPKVFNEVDRFILARLRSESIDPSPICTDFEFARRVYVDVVGVIPTGEEVKAFVGDSSPNKRAKLIDKLLNDNERYADHWEVMWGDWLREHTNGKKEGVTAGSYRDYLRTALKTNMPYDKFVKEMITATGYPSKNPATNFYMRDKQDRVESVNTVSQAFMGSRMACAQCHDHPFDKWTQNDFHGLMAFFSQTTVTKAPKIKKGEPVGPQEEAHVEEKPKGEYHMPADGDSAKKGGNKGGEIVKPMFAWDHSISGDAAASCCRCWLTAMSTACASRKCRPTVFGRSSWGAALSNRPTTSAKESVAADPERRVPGAAFPSSSVAGDNAMRVVRF